jgi:hypothetical protein
LSIYIIDKLYFYGHVLSKRGRGYELRAVHRAPGTEGASGATGFLGGKGLRMKRIFSLLAVTVLMVAMLVATALPAFADTGGVPDNDACHGQLVAKGLIQRPGQFQKDAGLPVQDQQDVYRDLICGR